MTTYRVAVLDQFCGPRPYALSQQPMRWTDFVSAVERGDYASRWNPHDGMRDVPADYEPPMATTVYIEQADGTVGVWRARWDTSG